MTPLLQAYLDDNGVAYTANDDGTATLTGDLTHPQITELCDVAHVVGCKVALTAGVLSVG